MTREQLNEKLIVNLCKEFQSVWLIKLEDCSLEVFTSDVSKIGPYSVDIALNMVTYDNARLWYVEHCVVENSKEKVLKETALENVLAETEGGKSFFIEYGRTMGGEINFNQLWYDRILDDEGTTKYIVMGFRDIDVRKRAEIDDLTGLLTRQTFFSKAEQMMREHPEEQFDVVISDIVDFKKINENYGVDVADDILKWEGIFLSKMSRENLLIGRYGGDQMALFGPHNVIDECMNQNNGATFWEAERTNGLPSISVKFGVYHDINHDRSIISSCDKAHTALNSIKRHYVKDVAFYDEKLKSQIDKQRRIENSMYDSLEKGDFKVYYQPKHDAKTGKLVGAEALIRWIHPEYGFMSPADFIPLFEQNGFIVENDKYVWVQTCKNLNKWEKMGIDTVPISINISKMTMSNVEVDEMKSSVEKYNVNPNKLHVEITESLMADDIDELVEKLNEIRELGFEIELDDFGSGYSSLNVLSTLPLDVVKLDMSFMRQFGDEKRSKVLSACVSLAKDMGFKTVSEGVEFAAQKEVLSHLGVDIIQGYYYSKPLPEEEFEKYMLEYK